jgi:chromosome partitioning protein
MKKDHIRIKTLPKERRQEAKVIATMNNKGGCGKTTTAIALGMYLARTGKNVLFWDNDPQSNLSQRLALPNKAYKDRRLNILFASAGGELDLSMIVKYPYLIRLKGSDVKPGIIGLMGGSDYAEIEANALHAKLEKGYSEIGHNSITSYFQESVRFFKSYYDYILIDTAPAMEGNILNKLAVKTAEEIIYPIDGIEAALGVKAMLRWMAAETKENDVKPNGVFAMVKYQLASRNTSSDLMAPQNHNTVHQAMKTTFNDFVCDHGVKESMRIRNLTAGFGGKTDYTALCAEIFSRINKPRARLFDYIQQDGVFNEFEKNLAEIQKRMLRHEPTFKTPRYQ